MYTIHTIHTIFVVHSWVNTWPLNRTQPTNLQLYSDQSTNHNSWFGVRRPRAPKNNFAPSSHICRSVPGYSVRFNVFPLIAAWWVHSFLSLLFFFSFFFGTYGSVTATTYIFMFFCNFYTTICLSSSYLICLFLFYWSKYLAQDCWVSPLQIMEAESA